MSYEIKKIKLKFEGEKLVCLGRGSKKLENELKNIIGENKAISIDFYNNVKGDVIGTLKKSTYFLKKSDYKRYKEIKRKQQEKPKRDLSGVMHLEARFEPLWWKKVMENTENFPNLFKPNNFSGLFTWFKTKEGHTFWNDVNNSLNANTPHECLVEPFKWIKDRPPTKEDADENGMFARFSKSKKGFELNSWHYTPLQLGLPWAPTSAMKQFSSENPAPSPFE